MRYVTLAEVVELHRRLLQATGGAPGIRDLAHLSRRSPNRRLPLAAPICIAALCFALIQDHPFVDGNKRVWHAAMETFFILNGAEIDASVDDQERLILDLAAGRIDRAHLIDWLRQHLTPLA